MKIGWHIGADYAWAFRHIADCFIEYWPGFEHGFNEQGDINIVMSPVYFKKMTVDGTTFLHLDGNRFYENQGVTFNEIIGMPAEKPRILSLVWAKDRWSWGLIYQRIHEALVEHFDFIPIAFEEYREKRLFIPCEKQDFFFCQNVTQLSCIKDDKKQQVIVRLGGIMNFVENNVVDYFLTEMSKCGAVIATSTKLYEIGLRTNKNTFLIPNPINLEKWCPDPERIWNYEKPVIGFVGNIATAAKIKYKGYDITVEACRALGLEVKQALYGKEQIPHDRMMADFWHKIDVLVLPTAGEGCSNSIMEALACGVPVITTRTAGYHGERLTNCNNVIFCERTAASIQACLEELIRFPGLAARIGQNGRKFAEEHHDINKIAAEYQRVFDAVVNRNKDLTPPVSIRSKNLKIFNFIWASGSWSWGAVCQDLFTRLYDEFPMIDVPHPQPGESVDKIAGQDSDARFFLQNINQIGFVPKGLRRHTISRLGGIMNFAGDNRAQQYLEEMAGLAALIATNKELYDIGQAANPNTYLIPNGRNLRAWKPKPGKEFNAQKPVIGFIGNVLTAAKTKYKGYDLVTRVCRDMGLELRQMLYKQNQVQNNEMQRTFWHQIDLFILPTDGEGCNNAIMEALCCGVPVITTTTAGYHGETLTDGESVIFCDKSYEGVMIAVKRMIGNPDLFKRLSLAGRKYAEAHHDVVKIAEQYRDVFRKHY